MGIKLAREIGLAVAASGGLGLLGRSCERFRAPKIYPPLTGQGPGALDPFPPAQHPCCSVSATCLKNVAAVGGWGAVSSRSGTFLFPLVCLNARKTTLGECNSRQREQMGLASTFTRCMSLTCMVWPFSHVSCAQRWPRPSGPTPQIVFRWSSISDTPERLRAHRGARADVPWKTEFLLGPFLEKA